MIFVLASAQILMKRRVWTMAQAYCVKCKKKVEIKNAKQITMKNKRPATQGVCPKCGTKVFRIGKA
jgi:NAD-dependent SIR2 family protein deacetylase